MSNPIQVGELMRQLFILREDGTVDLDMLAAHLHAEEIHGKFTAHLQNPVSIKIPNLHHFQYKNAEN